MQELREGYMKEISKKAISVILSAAMVLATTGCASKDESKEKILKVATNYAKFLKERRFYQIANLSTPDFEEIKSEWETRLDFNEGELYDHDASEAIKTVADTITYEIDNDVQISVFGDEGTVTVTYLMADYETLLEEQAHLDGFVAAAKEGNHIVEVDVPLTFKKENDQWLCSNYEQALETLYAFTQKEYEFTIPLYDYITDYSWLFVDYQGNAHNTRKVNLVLCFASDAPYEIDDLSYTVDYNDHTIYAGELDRYYDQDVVELSLSIDEIPEFTDPSGSFLMAGSYVLSIYTADGDLVQTYTVTVTTDVEDVVFEDELFWQVEYDNHFNDPAYTNVYSIATALQFSGVSSFAASRVTLEYNGEVIQEEYDTNVFTSYVYDPEIPMDPDNRYYAEGTYTVTFYDANDNVLASDSIEIFVE